MDDAPIPEADLPSATEPDPPDTPTTANGVAELHRTAYQPVLRFLIVQGAQWAEAHDAVQEAFMEACRPGVLARVLSPHAWLRKVAYRSWLRRDGRSPVQLVELSAAAAESFPDWQTPLQALELSTEHRKVLDILQDLPAKQRQVMAWHMDGFSTQEIAAGMDIREDAVRQNLSRARSTLKAKLGLEATGGGEAAK